MMMKKICVVAFLLISLLSKAQAPLKLKISSAEGFALEGASIRLESGKKVFNSITDANGISSFRSIFTPARINISFAGYETIDTVIQTWNADEISIKMIALRAALQPVEIRGLRASDNSPFAKTNISKKNIEKNNLGQDIPFLLNQTPNVVINSDAGNGVGYTGIRIRGTDASRINMTINGIPYNDAESQGIFFVNLPDLLSSVSSIQIQRGVGTSSNGAGAFGASMNFSTHSYNPNAYAEINNSIGSFETYKNTLKIGSGLIGKHVTIDARLSNISSQGYIDRASSNLQSGQFTVSYYANKSSIRFNAILGKEKTYQAWYGVSESDLKASRTINYAGTEKPGEPYDNETDNYWQNHYQLFFNHEFNQKTIFNTAFYLTTGKGYYEQYKADETLADYGIPPLMQNGTSVTETDLVRQLWLKNKLLGQVISLQINSGKNEWTLGGGWSFYPGQHYGDVIWSAAQPNLYKRWYDYSADKTDANVYVKWNYHLTKQLNLFSDVQYRFVDYHIEGFRNNPDVKVNEQWHFINPKTGLAYSNGNWSGFISYALGNKEPNRDDFEAGENQLPRREQLHDFEFNMTNKQLAPNLQLGATLYYMYYRDQLVLTGKVNDVGAYTRVNIPKSYRAGAELEAAFRYSKGIIRYNFGVSTNKLLDFTEYIDDYDNGGQQAIYHGNTDISFSPSLVQFFSASYLPVQQLEFEWMTKQVGRQYLDNTSNESRSLDPYLLTDLRASYTLNGRKWLKEAKLVLQVNNVFNALYEPNGYTFSYYYNNQLSTENYYYPMAGTNWMLALNIKL